MADLERLAKLVPRRILPCHGDPKVIAGGGYGPGLIEATRRYVGWLLSLPGTPERAGTPIEALLAEDIAAGNIVWFPAYAEVHASNVRAMLGGGGA